LHPHDRLAASRRDILIGRSGRNGFVGQAVQALEFRIAQHQPVIRVPHHERFRDRLDRIAQPHFGSCAFFREPLLLGDVDRDTDEMRMRLSRIAD
jgi:hypothetical protein